MKRPSMRTKAWKRRSIANRRPPCARGSGTQDKSMTRERLAEIRVQEQQEAADMVGIKQIVWLGFEDGYLYPDLDLRKAVAREIRRFRPDVIFTHTTERLMADFYANHP